MELGNLFWGNSRGNFEVDRIWQDVMIEILDWLGCDGYGLYQGRNPWRENKFGGVTTEHFVVRPYYWGEDEDIAELPNFEYHYGDIDITIDWYKYPLRDSYSNIEIENWVWDAMLNRAREESDD